MTGRNIWFVSDTHFGHTNAWQKFKRADGSPLRPFTSTEEMDETMVQRWNERVRPQDKIYHLGDIAMSKKHLPILGRLNGHKRLIQGNHDTENFSVYGQYFEEIYSLRVLNSVVFTHIPLHPDSVNERWHGNVHGHLHANEVPHPRFLCVCVEHTNYAPIHLDEVMERLAAKKHKYADFKEAALCSNQSGRKPGSN